MSGHLTFLRLVGQAHESTDRPAAAISRTAPGLRWTFRYPQVNMPRFGSRYRLQEKRIGPISLGRESNRVLRSVDAVRIDRVIVGTTRRCLDAICFESVPSLKHSHRRIVKMARRAIILGSSLLVALVVGAAAPPRGVICHVCISPSLCEQGQTQCLTNCGFHSAAYTCGVNLNCVPQAELVCYSVWET